MRKKLRILAIVLAVLLATTVTVYAAYDSTTDPLISKSYLEQIFKSQIEAEINSLRDTITTQSKTIEDLTQKYVDLLSSAEKWSTSAEEVTKQNEELIKQIEELKKQNEEAAKLIAEQAGKIKTLEETAGTQDKAISELSGKVGILETTSKAAQNLMNTFLTRISEIESKLATLTKSSAQHTDDITLLKTQLGDLSKAVDTLRTAVSLISQNSGATDGGEIKVIHLVKGQRLICNGGSDVSTEIYLRAGEAIAVSQYDSDGAFAQGLADLTHGKELFKNDPLEINAYIIVPRGDGRGVKVTSDEAYFLVRGKYTIMN